MRYRLFRPNFFQYFFFTNFPIGYAVWSEILAQSYNSQSVTTNYLGSPTSNLCVCVAETQILQDPVHNFKGTFSHNVPICVVLVWFFLVNKSFPLATNGARSILMGSSVLFDTDPACRMVIASQAMSLGIEK